MNIETYNKESLIQVNPSYHADHGISDKDVFMANVYKLAIESSRSRLGQPYPGDILWVNGERTHIETVEDGKVTYCRFAMTPFTSIRFNGSHATIKTDTSGGPWGSIPLEAVAGTCTAIQEKKKKAFCFWGGAGMRANGAITIYATVNVFKAS